LPVRRKIPKKNCRFLKNVTLPRRMSPPTKSLHESLKLPTGANCPKTMCRRFRDCDE
jgi:hypothetical protein